MLEWIGAGLGLAGVLLGIRQHVWTWWFFAASSLIYLWLYWTVGLYGQVLLMAVFIGLSLWGLKDWSARAAAANEAVLSTQTHGEPHWMPTKPLLGYLAAALAIWWVLWTLMRSTDNPSVVMDTLVTAISILAMRWMSLKAHQAWLAWALANGLSVWLFMGQALYATTALYTLQLVLSFVGLRQWLRSQ
jgi:nicotinamide mononucleotide transporter